MPEGPPSRGAQPGFGEAVTAIRTSLGLSQAVFATRAGMPVCELDEVEKGEGDPTWEMGQRLAQGLGLPLSAIAVVAELLDQGLIKLVAKPVSGAPRAEGR